LLAIGRGDASRAFCVTPAQFLLCAAVDRVADDQFDPRNRIYWRRTAVSFGRGAELTARTIVAALATLMTLGALAPVQGSVDRPPQFIVMGFDNCTELERWRELTDFAAELNKDGDRVHFTFFVPISSPTPVETSTKAHTSAGAIPASTSAARPSRFANASNT
jgi:hypothetical protein